jgi:hypothetical protein
VSRSRRSNDELGDEVLGPIEVNSDLRVSCRVDYKFSSFPVVMLSNRNPLELSPWPTCLR